MKLRAISSNCFTVDRCPETGSVNQYGSRSHELRGKEGDGEGASAGASAVRQSGPCASTLRPIHRANALERSVVARLAAGVKNEVVLDELASPKAIVVVEMCARAVVDLCRREWGACKRRMRLRALGAGAPVSSRCSSGCGSART